MNLHEFHTHHHSLNQMNGSEAGEETKSQNVSFVNILVGVCVAGRY